MPLLTVEVPTLHHRRILSDLVWLSDDTGVGSSINIIQDPDNDDDRTATMIQYYYDTDQDFFLLTKWQQTRASSLDFLSWFHNRHNWCSAFLAECDVEHDDLIIWIEDKTEKRERVHHSHRLQSQDRHYYRLLIHHLLSQCMIISAVFLSRSSSWVIVSSSLIVMVTFHTEYLLI